MRNILLLIVILVTLSCQQSIITIPLAEHPRPDFERAQWQNLNGYWQFAADSANVGLSENWYLTPKNFKQKILVPFSWASPMSEIALPDLHYGWYARNFTIETNESWKDKNVYLVFGASDFHTTVWVNGLKTCEHEGGYTPFEANITVALKPGKNQLVVRVEDEDIDNRPSGKQYYGNARGIWQTVYLEARNQVYITDIRFTPDIDAGKVNVMVQWTGTASAGSRFNLSGKDNGIDFDTELPAGDSIAKFDIPVENMRLWTLDDPFLYEVKARLVAGKQDDEVSTYFGMRKISAVTIPGKEFSYVALNNEPLYLKLALDQSYHPEGFYTFPSDLFMKEEIMRAKNLGLNGLRIHIKAEIPRKLYWADKLGLLIQEDIPNFWGEPTPQAKANWEFTAVNQLKRDYNHPSIFSWVLFNETWGLFSKDSITKRRSYTPETQEWVRSWYHKAKAIDPTRLVEDNSPCNWDHVATDLNTWHAYLPARHWSGFLDNITKNTFPGSSHNFIGGNLQGNQPMFNSECGAVWGYDGSTGDIDLTWEYHIMMNEFRKRPKIAGFLFTEFHDVINEWNGYYRFDRTSKEFGIDELNHGMSMKDFHHNLYVIPGNDFYTIYDGGVSVNMPLAISAVSQKIPEGLSVNYSVYGWNQLGDYFDLTKGTVPARALPFECVDLTPVSFQAPDETAVMIFATVLKDSQGNELQRNFVPFRIIKSGASNTIIQTVPASGYSNSSWSIKQLSPQQGKKVWGMGSGFFEYEFDVPAGTNAEAIGSVEFRAELAARFPQEKYLEDGELEGIGMTVVSTKGIIPGYGKNSYPQTDEKTFASTVIITANGQKIAEAELSDDPADHRGLLSWMNQVPGNDFGTPRKNNPWLLDEAGSYGYLVKAKLDENAIQKAFETRKIVIRLHVDETTPNRGGLSVYGKESGRFPFDPTIVFYPK